MFAAPASSRTDATRSLADIRAALRSGDMATAEALLQLGLTQSPNDADLLATRATLLADQGRLVDALMTLRRALVRTDNPDPLHIGVARLLARQSEHAGALAEIERAGGKVRSAFDVRAFEAALLGILGMHEREIELYEGLVRDEPRNADLWMSYGNALKTVGRTDDAIAAMRRALAARPGFGEAYWSLANFKSFTFTDRDLAAIRKQLSGKVDPQSAIHFHFALGKALEERRDYEASFRHYDAGNRLKAAGLSAGQMTIAPRVDAVIDLFDRQLLEDREGQGCQSPEPIFVVGLQRSGSTLIEQILASHPSIEGTSELTALEQVWMKVGSVGERTGNPFREIARLDAAELRALGEDYLARAAPFRLTGKPFFVDKLPANWLNIGLIRLILPNAKIIDARRHPMACGFSNFKQLYATGVSFAYSLESIGAFYRDYLRLTEHFERLRPGIAHRIVNERLIDDPEGEVRRLLDFVGVPFDAACLQFHQTRRAIATPSAEQVRRPINRDGVDSWRPFEPWLTPLQDSLGDALETWDRTRS